MHQDFTLRALSVKIYVFHSLGNGYSINNSFLQFLFNFSVYNNLSTYNFNCTTVYNAHLQNNVDNLKKKISLMDWLSLRLKGH